MRTRIDREWAFNGLPVVRRVSVDGGLNGWIVDAGTRGGPFTISYEPERNFLIAAVVEVACYLSLMAAGVSRIRRSRL
jgi:hypothetical protein